MRFKSFLKIAVSKTDFFGVSVKFSTNFCNLGSGFLLVRRYNIAIIVTIIFLKLPIGLEKTFSLDCSFFFCWNIPENFLVNYEIIGMANILHRLSNPPLTFTLWFKIEKRLKLLLFIGIEGGVILREIFLIIYFIIIIKFYLSLLIKKKK